MGVFPAVLALAFGAAGLEGFQAGQGLDQQRLAFGAQGEAALHCIAQAHLDQVGEEGGDGEGEHGDHHQPAAEQADHQQHQQREGQVDQAGEGHRGEEFPQALEVVDALGETADRDRPGLERHAGDALEQGGREDDVGLLPGAVQQVGAQDPQQQVEAGTDQQADGEHPEGRGGLVGHHAVVGLHHEERHQHAQQVDQQARQHGVGVEPAGQLEGVAEPGLQAGYQGVASFLQFMARAGEQGLAGVLQGQGFVRYPLLAAVRLAGQDQRATACVQLGQHRAAATLEQQQKRQVERRDGCQVAAQQARLQAGAGRRAGQQFGGQALAGQWQAAAQAGAAGRAAMQPAEDQQAVEQRVVMALVRVPRAVSPLHGGHGHRLLRPLTSCPAAGRRSSLR
ncbi:hypothetical protein D3C85_625530 [compost metagenome]